MKIKSLQFWSIYYALSIKVNIKWTLHNVFNNMMVFILKRKRRDPVQKSCSKNSIKALLYLSEHNLNRTRSFYVYEGTRKMWKYIVMGTCFSLIFKLIETKNFIWSVLNRAVYNCRLSLSLLLSDITFIQKKRKVKNKKKCRIFMQCMFSLRKF